MFSKFKKEWKQGHNLKGQDLVVLFNTKKQMTRSFLASFVFALGVLYFFVIVAELVFGLHVHLGLLLVILTYPIALYVYGRVPALAISSQGLRILNLRMNLAWEEIKFIRYYQSRHPQNPEKWIDYVWVMPKEGVLSSLSKWITKHGFIISLEDSLSPTKNVIAAIENYMPVQRDA